MRPNLARALLVGPLSHVSLRLQGLDSLATAPEQTAEAAAVFGAIRSVEMTVEERAMHDLVSGTRQS